MLLLLQTYKSVGHKVHSANLTARLVRCFVLKVVPLHYNNKQAMTHSKDERLEAFSRLLDVLDNLRTHCPWDRKQTNESLRANTIEEVYELSEALEQGDTNAISKELGDVLLHVLFYARIGDEQGDFDIVDVCNKLIFRHPHIYATEQVEDAGQVVQLWEQVKQKEKDGNKSVLSGVPSALPALIKAYRIQDKARAVGFDWQEREEVWAKVREELQEVEQEMTSGSADDLEAEIGDLLFSIVNAARLYGVNPDNALERTNRKFIDRFEYIERTAKTRGQSITDLSLEEMETLWQEAKKGTSK